MALSIESYALIGDCETAALVGRDSRAIRACRHPPRPRPLEYRRALASHLVEPHG
jgi:hypothetical protein